MRKVKIRRILLLGAWLLGLACGLAGCDKVSELADKAKVEADKIAQDAKKEADRLAQEAKSATGTGGTPASTGTATGNSTTGSAATGSSTTSPPDKPANTGTPAAAVNPEEVIKVILAKPSKDVTDLDLHALAALPSGLDTIHRLDLSLSTVTDAGLAHLPKFSHLKELHLSGLRFSDQSLALVGQLKTLETLSLHNTNMSSDRLAHIKDLSHLRRLLISENSEIKDAGFEHLAPLLELTALDAGKTGINGSGFKLFRKQKLHEIGVSNTLFGHAGFPNIKDLKSLEVLNAKECGVSDAQMSYLRGCVNLRELDISNNAVGNVGFMELKGMQKLERVIANNNRVDDACLPALRGKKSLKQLDLTSTGCSPAGVAALIKTLPSMKGK